ARRARSDEEDGAGRSIRAGGGRLLSTPRCKPRSAHGLERNARVRLADFLRLLRIHGHGDRHGGAAGVSFPTQLPKTIPGVEYHRFLAPLAHVAFPVAARLPVYPAGRKSAWDPDDLPQPDAHHAAGRPVARRELELRDLGRLPRRFAKPGTQGAREG